MGKNATRVLALSPSVNLTRSRDYIDLHRVLAGMLQVALLTGRVMALPDLPCETPFLHEGGHQDCTTNSTGGMRLKWGVAPRLVSPPDVQPPRYMVSPFHALGYSCLSTGHGVIFNAEFEHWLSAEAPKNTSTHPVAGNTLLVANPADAMLHNASGPVVDTMVRLKADNVIDAADALADVPLVFLGHPVEVELDSMEVEVRTTFKDNAKWCYFLHKKLGDWAIPVSSDAVVDLGKSPPAHVKNNIIYHGQQT